MRIICSKQNLLQGVETVQMAVSPKITLPILSNFLLETEKDKIKLSGTDLEVGICTFTPVEIIKPGNITIPAKKFFEIIRELPDEKIEINTDESNRITIICAQSHFLINGLSKEDYPLLPEFKEDKAIALPRTTLQKMLKKTSFAVSTDETRYVLNGVCLIFDNTQIKMVATDGRRLAYISEELNPDATVGAGKQMQVIIPTKAANQLMHLLTESGEETVKMSIGENQIGFKINSTILISRLIEGNFPNYEQVIPKNYVLQLKLNTKEFLQVTKRVSLLVSDKGGSVKYDLKGNILRVSSISPGIGEAEEKMVAQAHPENLQLEIAFNPTYVLDVLKVIDSEEIYLELTSSLNPGVIRPSSKEEYLCVLMPMRLE